MVRTLSWRRIAVTALALLVVVSLTLLWLRWGETVFVRQLGALVC
jgi:hypothetical protein